MGALGAGGQGQVLGPSLRIGALGQESQQCRGAQVRGVPGPVGQVDGLTADLLQHARRGDDGNARSSNSALSMRVWRKWAMTWARRPSGLRGLTFQGAASCRRGGRQTCILLAVRSSIIRCRWNRRLRAEMRERLVAGRTWRAFGERARHLVVSCFGLFCLV